MKQRSVLAIALVLLCGTAGAQTVLTQTQTGTLPSAQVQQLAPQLLAFAGGDANFQNLVNGLAFGVPVTLTTAVSPGVTQVVSFTPTGTLSAVQIAQLLETARQSLIAIGVASPSAQQIGITLVGGALPTASGATTTMPTLVGTAAFPATSGAGATAATTTPTQTSPAALLQQGLASNGITVRNTSDSPFPRGVADTPQAPVPGVTVTPSGTPVAGSPATTSTSTAPFAPVASPSTTGTAPAGAATTAPIGGRGVFAPR